MLILLGCLCLSTLVQAHPGLPATLDHLTRMIAEEPGNPSLYHQRGVAYLHDQQYRAALSDLQYAAELGDPRMVALHLGIIQLHYKNYPMARDRFDSYLAFRPGNITALQYRARLRSETGDLEGALADYSAVIALRQPAHPVDYLSAAALMVELPAYGVEAAIALLDQGMAKLGAVPQLQLRAIELEGSIGRYDEATLRLQLSGPGASSSPFWQLEMAKLLLAAGHTERAQQHLSIAGQQLSKLRRTPARVKLADELHALLVRSP